MAVNPRITIVNDLCAGILLDHLHDTFHLSCNASGSQEDAYKLTFIICNGKLSKGA